MTKVRLGVIGLGSYGSGTYNTGSEKKQIKWSKALPQTRQGFLYGIWKSPYAYAIIKSKIKD